MDDSGRRALVSQLADDLGWLEEHCRRHPEQAAQAGQLRLAGALVRNCVGPFLDDQPATPLHVAVVGGAGAGKSTVANFLSGAPAAEANPQAGFTRHPVAYTSTNGVPGWSGHLGLLGPLQRLAEPCPANLDADVYQVRKVPADPSGFHLLRHFIVWDCPDMTTWAAGGYVPRLLEVAGDEMACLFEAADPFAPATFPVGWAGESESPMWFDIAREYTERWHHQRQIAMAVSRPTPIDGRRLYHPVLDTFLRALPFTYRGVAAPAGTTVLVTIIGEAGGDWFVRRTAEGWELLYETEGRPDSTVAIDQSDAWLLFTKRTARSTARARFPSIRVEGDTDLGESVLEMISIMS